MLPRFRPSFAVRELVSSFLGRGPSLPELENEFAQDFGYGYAVWFPMGRIAVQAFLESLRAREPEVVVSAFNCVALGNAVVNARKSPLYVDTGPDSFNQDLSQFGDALAENSVAAGILVSQWGIPPGTFDGGRKAILHDFALRALDRSTPLLKERDAVLYSLGWGKPFSSAGGAFLCTHEVGRAAMWSRWRDERLQLANGLKDFLNLFAFRAATSPRLFTFSEKLGHTALAGHLRGIGATRSPELARSQFRGISSGVALLTLEALFRYDDVKEERVRQIQFYLDSLGELTLKGLRLPPAVPHLSHFPVLSEEREFLHERLREKGVFSSKQLFDRLLEDYPWLKGRRFAELTNARALCRKTLHLPLFPRLTEEEQNRVATGLNEIFSQSRDRHHETLRA